MIAFHSVNIDGESIGSLQDLYESTVHDQLTLIESSRTGKLVLEAINQSGFTVTIKPSPGLDPHIGDAFTERNELLALKPEGTTSKKCTDPKGGDLLYTPGTLNLYPTGVIVDLKRLPHSPRGRFIQNWTPPYAPSRDETLLHELFHKLRMARGQFCDTPFDDDYDYVEEFYAILVTNIYRSENGHNQVLRANHRLKPYKVLTLSSHQFWDKYTMRIGLLRGEMKEFTKEISKVSCPFNPIREDEEFSESMRHG